ncbi:MAG: DUF58 domain-containing protein [Thiotrichales bacterium]
MNGVNLELNDMLKLRAKARSLKLNVRHLARAARAGTHRSSQRGRGLEFDEVRIYQPGDDVRSIDWRVTAKRGGRPHTKVFREERERPVLLLTDLNPSMYFGTRRVFKSVLAMQLSALVAWAAEQNGDRVGGVVGSAKGHAEIPPRPRRSGVLALLKSMERLQPTEPGEIHPGRFDSLLERMHRVAHPGSLIVIFSDFLEMGGDTERLLAALKQHNDLLIGMISDPLESALPDTGQLRIGTPQQSIDLDTGNVSTREHWQAQFAQKQAKVEAMCRRYGIPLQSIQTDDSKTTTLSRLLAS